MALSLLRTLDNIATPCSVKAIDKYLECFSFPSKVKNCDLRNDSSLRVSSRKKGQIYFGKISCKEVLCPHTFNHCYQKNELNGGLL
jgi:hypothetical protein